LSVTTPPFGVYTLSLHDALPISARCRFGQGQHVRRRGEHGQWDDARPRRPAAHLRTGLTGDGGTHLPHGSEDEEDGDRGRSLVRSEEHTSELQSHLNLVCRLLLE